MTIDPGRILHPAIRPLNGELFIFLLQFVDFRDKFLKIFARWMKIYVMELSSERQKMWKPILKQLSIGRRWFKFCRFTRSIPDLVEDRSKKPYWRQILEQTEVGADMVNMVIEDNNSLHRMGLYRIMGVDSPWMSDQFQWMENHAWNTWCWIAVPVSFLDLSDKMEKYAKAKKDISVNADQLAEVKEKTVLAVGKCIKAVCELIESSHDCGFINKKKTSIVCGLISGCTSFYKAISKIRRLPK
eukprot:gene1055-731_t